MMWFNVIMASLGLAVSVMWVVELWNMVKYDSNKQPDDGALAQRSSPRIDARRRFRPTARAMGQFAVASPQDAGDCAARHNPGVAQDAGRETGEGQALAESLPGNEGRVSE